MIKYFPFTPDFNLKMGTAPMQTHDTVVESDEHYLDEIRLKRSLLSENHKYYFDAVPESESAQWEAVDLIFTDLTKHDPQNFSFTQKNNERHFSNKKLDEAISFISGDKASLAYAPLDIVGRQVQEDLILLNAEGYVVAGQLCFPSGWAMDEKLGKQFLDVHAPLPRVTDQMIQTANKFLERIPAGKSFSRNNWGFRLGNQLDLSSRHSEVYRELLKTKLPKLSTSLFREEIFLRVEHQTLTRLPKSGFILFTIHTYNSSLKEEASNHDRAKTMLSFLKEVPKELIEYKVITPFYEELITYLTEASLQGT